MHKRLNVGKIIMVLSYCRSANGSLFSSSRISHGADEKKIPIPEYLPLRIYVYIGVNLKAMFLGPLHHPYFICSLFPIKPTYIYIYTYTYIYIYIYIYIYDWIFKNVPQDIG